MCLIDPGTGVEVSAVQLTGMDPWHTLGAMNAVKHFPLNPRL